MASKAQIRKIELKIPLAGWQWIDTKEMTLETAVATARQAITEDTNGAYRVRISKMGRIWTTEFEGDQDFNYIGV